jgi:hypothetical protein
MATTNNFMKSKSLEMAKKYLGKEVSIKIDRPIGSVHPKFDDTLLALKCEVPS